MSKIHHMSKVMRDLNIFSKEIRARQYISDKTQTFISLIKDELQTSIEKVISCQNKWKTILIKYWWTKKTVDYESYWKPYYTKGHIIK